MPRKPGPRTPEDLEKRREKERQKREAAQEAVKDRSFWVCRTCGNEVIFDDGLWRDAELLRIQSNWKCPDKIINGDISRDDAYLALRPGFNNYYHDGQEIDPAADLMRILSEL